MRFALSRNGGMAEWFKAAVLKTASLKGDVGSNPTPSAMYFRPSTSLSLGESRSESDIDIESGQIRQVGVERCPRGRRGSPAKRVSPLKGDRGFESLSLRHGLCNVNNWNKG